MLTDQQRLFIARHLVSGVPGLAERLLSQSTGTFWPDALEWLHGGAPTPAQKIIGLAALDVWNGSGKTLLGEAIASLDRATFKRLIDVLQAMV